MKRLRRWRFRWHLFRGHIAVMTVITDRHPGFFRKGYLCVTCDGKSWPR